MNKSIEQTFYKFNMSLSIHISAIIVMDSIGKKAGTLLENWETNLRINTALA